MENSKIAHAQSLQYTYISYFHKISKDILPFLKCLTNKEICFWYDNQNCLFSLKKYNINLYRLIVCGNNWYTHFLNNGTY